MSIPDPMTKTVLFACIHNAGRSQMAAAFFNQLAHLEKARAISAGIDPGDRIPPRTESLVWKGPTTIRNQGRDTVRRALPARYDARGGLL